MPHVSDLLIVGNQGGTHVGWSLWNAPELGISARFGDAQGIRSAHMDAPDRLEAAGPQARPPGEVQRGSGPALR